MKKLLELLKIRKPTPKMYYRLQSLLIYFQIVDVNSERIIITENDNTSCSFKFYSKLGAVEITLQKFLNEHGHLVYSMDYTTYAGIKLFSMACSDQYVKVSPCMGYAYNISAKEIDLAVFELEEYLKNEYGDFETLLNGYLTAQRLAKTSHEEQIKYLEKP